MSNGFLTELARFGPETTYAPPSRADAQAYCSRLARSHYENFSVASTLLPRRLIRHFHAVYAYCRWADDLADESGGGPQALELLRWWRAELLDCYAGRPHHPVFVALHDTIRRFDIPPQPFLDLLSAFEQDQLVKNYDTFDALLDYCRRSANPVGRLVLYLGEAFDAESAALSDDICTALQLANFWQDVARDYALGRVYLPREDRSRFGYSDDDLAAHRFTPSFAALLRFEVERTRALFYRGLPLAERVPETMRTEIELFVRGGLAILRKIERQNYNVWMKRPALAKWEKGLLLAGALGQRIRRTFRLSAMPSGERGNVALRCKPEPNEITLSASYVWCERLARQQAGNFHHAFRLLPVPQRRAMCALYAFMRVTDDLTDGSEAVEDKRLALTNWRQQLDGALEGDYRHPLHPAFHHTVVQFGIPRRFLDDVLDGVGMDLDIAHYDTFSELYGYCYRVASAVGLACIHIWGFRGDKATEYAESAGIALQLTNILRDLGEDAARGRIYLPREDLERFGYSVADLERGRCDERFRALMRFQVERARRYYESAMPLGDSLDPAGRAVFLVMLRTYRGLLETIERRDYDVFSSRVRLSRVRKLWLATQVLPISWGWR
jgi:squalene synthase HpnC/squalene synthase HpnD